MFNGELTTPLRESFPRADQRLHIVGANILRTYTRKDFIETAAHCDTHGHPVVWDRTRDPGFLALKKAWHEIPISPEMSKAELSEHFDFILFPFFTDNGKIKNLKVKEPFRHVVSDHILMAELAYAVSPIDSSITLDTNIGLHTKPDHTHGKGLTLTWGQEQGTKTYNSRGEAVYACEGEIVCLPSLFVHGSPEGDKRFTLVSNPTNPHI